jgi:hypothetical protein
MEALKSSMKGRKARRNEAARREAQGGLAMNGNWSTWVMIVASSVVVLGLVFHTLQPRSVENLALPAASPRP